MNKTSFGEWTQDFTIVWQVTLKNYPFKYYENFNKNFWLLPHHSQHWKQLTKWWKSKILKFHSDTVFSPMEFKNAHMEVNFELIYLIIKYLRGVIKKSNIPWIKGRGQETELIKYWGRVQRIELIFDLLHRLNLLIQLFIKKRKFIFKFWKYYDL